MSNSCIRSNNQRIRLVAALLVENGMITKVGRTGSVTAPQALRDEYCLEDHSLDVSKQHEVECMARSGMTPMHVICRRTGHAATLPIRNGLLIYIKALRLILPRFLRMESEGQMFALTPRAVRRPFPRFRDPPDEEADQEYGD
jgi:hypothetical protein